MSAALAQQIARYLLQIRAVSLRPDEPFTWTSGIKSPIYCDNRLTMSFPKIRDAIAEGFSEVIKTHFPNVDAVAGTATAGIPHAAWVAQKLESPMIYIRDKAKGHGKQNQIEGLMNQGDRVVVIEDLISTGGSSIKAANAVREAGGIVLGIVAIFTYEFDDAHQAFADAGIPLFTLSNYRALIEEALHMGYIEKDAIDKLEAWRLDRKSFGN